MKLMTYLSVALVAIFLFFLPYSAKTGDQEQMSDLLRQIKQIECSLIHYNTLSPDYFGYIKGRIPILISAPHGAKHYRARWGSWKEEDAYTSALAIKLGELTGAHVLYVKNKTLEDPNSDLTSAYKNFLKKVVERDHIAFVLDLHGSRANQPFKIDVGTISNDLNKSSCPRFRQTIQETFAGFEPRIFNQKFCAGGPGTITCYARQGLGVESAQIEINANYRIVESKTNGFKGNCSGIEDLINRLQKMILAINEQISQTR